MFTFITKLRTRSLAYRRRFAFWSAAAITGLIALVWIISLSVRFGDTAASPKPQTPGPFETFMGQVRRGFSSVGDSFGETNN